MPSSSLFLRSSTTLATVLSLLSATASADVYKLASNYGANDFVDTNQFDWVTKKDPSNGFVTYLDKDSAANAHIMGVQDNVFYMNVDSTNVYDPNGPGRPSIRIESKQRWDKGLWVGDFNHMPPSTCGLWPAFWTLGENWPNNGEIDIIEGVNNRNYRISVLHDGQPGSQIDPNNAGTGTVLNTDCYYNVKTGEGAVGCAIQDGQDSYGTGFNKAGGKIVAMEWTDAAIKVWSFNHGSAPSDISSSNPNPNNWPTPQQIFTGDKLNIAQNFHNHQFILNTDFCGDFGNAVWSSEGCAAQTGYSTCAAYVAAKPEVFKDAYWAVNSVKVFQKAAVVSTTTASTTTTTSTTTSSSTTTTTTTTSSVSTTTTTSPSSSSTTTTTTYSYPYYGNATTTGTYTTSTYTGTISPIILTTTTTSSYSWTTSSTTSSSSGWSAWTTSSGWSLPAATITAFPHGGSVPGAASWAAWQDPAAKNTYVTTTITKTYVVPCSTGWASSTAYITTAYPGGMPATWTPAPAMTTYVTTCPAEWGLGTAGITVTIPVTQGYTLTWVNGKPTVTANPSSWDAWTAPATKATPAAVSATGTWSNWNAAPTASTFKTSSKTPDATTAASWSGWSSAAKTPDATSSQPFVQPSAGPNWDAWSGSNITSPIATYKGAASKATGGFTGLIGVVGLVAVFML